LLDAECRDFLLVFSHHVLTAVSRQQLRSTTYSWLRKNIKYLAWFCASGVPWLQTAFDCKPHSNIRHFT